MSHRQRQPDGVNAARPSGMVQPELLAQSANEGADLPTNCPDGGTLAPPAPTAASPEVAQTDQSWATELALPLVPGPAPCSGAPLCLEAAVPEMDSGTWLGPTGGGSLRASAPSSPSPSTPTPGLWPHPAPSPSPPGPCPVSCAV